MLTTAGTPPTPISRSHHGRARQQPLGGHSDDGDSGLATRQFTVVTYSGAPDNRRVCMDRSNARAKELGLTLRPLEQTLADALAWERVQGFDRPRKAGMTTDEQDQLIVELTGEQHA